MSKKSKVEKIILEPVLIGLKPGEDKIGVKIEVRVTPEKWEMVPVRYLEIELHLGKPMLVEIPIEVVEGAKHD